MKMASSRVAVVTGEIAIVATDENLMCHRKIR